jgi:hypothetical protein
MLAKAGPARTPRSGIEVDNRMMALAHKQVQKNGKDLFS